MKMEDEFIKAVKSAFAVGREFDNSNIEGLDSYAKHVVEEGDTIVRLPGGDRIMLRLVGSKQFLTIYKDGVMALVR
jgi:hypothetical protein